MYRYVLLLAAGAAVVAGCTQPSWSGDDRATDYGLGYAATEEEIQAWNIDISPDGTGLPPGQGTVEQGAQVYRAKCAKCHGATGIEGPFDVLVGGHGTLKTARPVRTIGSFWPYATTLFDYINRAMPFDAPQSLTADEIYAVIAWLLHKNGIISAETVIDAKRLPAIEMPNRRGFIRDPRPDVHQ